MHFLTYAAMRRIDKYNIREPKVFLIKKTRNIKLVSLEQQNKSSTTYKKKRSVVIKKIKDKDIINTVQ